MSTIILNQDSIGKALNGSDKRSLENKLRRLESRRISVKMLYLRDIGDHIGMFEGTHTRKPTGYIKLNDPVESGYMVGQVKNPTPL